MAKGDDAIMKKRIKKNRKKQNKDSSKVSTRIAAVIAAKKRRVSGKRRMCQGMCFSLPTPEDPFNDGQGKVDSRRKDNNKKLVASKADQRLSTERNSLGGIRKGSPKTSPKNLVYQEQKMLKVDHSENEPTISLASINQEGQRKVVKLGEPRIQRLRKCGDENPREQHAFENLGCPSKFLISCLNSIQDALCHDGAFSFVDDKPLFFDSWGLDFWKFYSIGKDILETSGACSTMKQIAWIASTAADDITRKEKEGVSITTPFLLFLVPSQEKAVKVRSVCKPLKAVGVHTVSLHNGASLDHQIHGLRSCEPEFIVSTPGRLLELVSLKALDISGVSLLVVDGIQARLAGGYIDIIKSIRQTISRNPQVMIFNDCLSYASIPVVRNILHGLICRLSLDDSIMSQSACIIQSVYVCNSEEERLSKVIQVLDQIGSLRFKVLFIIGNNRDFQQSAASIISSGYLVSTDLSCSNSGSQISKLGHPIFMINSQGVSEADLDDFEVVIMYDAARSIDIYVKILTGMARCTVDGKLHSFLTLEDAPLAGPLIEILEKCQQPVPEALRHLRDSSMLLDC